MHNQEPIKKGHLKVSQLHEIYYEVCGNPKGIPFLFIHGGPGAGFGEADKRFFDFTKHKVIFYDQRGASRSKPYGSITENTTAHLVQDITYLLDYLKIKTIYIVGGSWGTTLALVYAIQYPHRISGLIVRSLFLANEAAINHYLGGGVQKYHPEAWTRFVNKVPKEKRSNIISYYLKQMLSGEDSFAYEWAFYELSIYQKNITAAKVKELLDKIPYQSLAILEAHYLANRCFLPANYLLKNAYKLKDISIQLIHGRFDMICPPMYAYAFNDRLAKSTLTIVDAGHSDKEESIAKELLSAIQNIKP